MLDLKTPFYGLGFTTHGNATPTGSPLAEASNTSNGSIYLHAQTFDSIVMLVGSLVLVKRVRQDLE